MLSHSPSSVDKTLTVEYRSGGCQAYERRLEEKGWLQSLLSPFRQAIVPDNMLGFKGSWSSRNVRGGCRFITVEHEATPASNEKARRGQGVAVTTSDTRRPRPSTSVFAPPRFLPTAARMSSSDIEIKGKSYVKS